MRRYLFAAVAQRTVTTIARSVMGFLTAGSELGLATGAGFLAALAADPFTSK